jgi:hypothetical protein
VKINLLEGHSRKNMARVKQVTPVILYLRTNSLEGALNKGDLSMEMTYLKEPDPFVRRWLGNNRRWVDRGDPGISRFD